MVEDKIPWYARNQASIEIHWDLLPGATSVKNWLFKFEAKLVRTDRKWNCFWPYINITILGLFIGAAIYVRGKRLEVNA